MAVPGSSESGAPSGLFHSLRALWAVAIAILHTRLDLLTAELEEEVFRAVVLIAVSLGALLCLGVTVFFSTLLLVAVFWDTHRLLVIGLVCLGYLVVSLVLAGLARQMVLTRPKFLSHTLDELRRDVAALNRQAPGADAPASETRP